MGSRYLITGAQIGMLISLHELNDNKFMKTLQEILNKQYVINTNNEIMKDIQKIKSLLIDDEKNN